MGFLDDYEPICVDCGERFTPSKYGPRPQRCSPCRRQHHNERTRLRNQERRGYRDKPATIRCEDCDVEVQVAPGAGGVPRRCSNCREVRRRGMLAGAYRRHHLKKLYGLTEEQHATLVVRQDARCAICRERHPRLVVDHDHLTGAIRGLLCSNCNTALGLLNESPGRLRNAAAYLEVSSARLPA